MPQALVVSVEDFAKMHGCRTDEVYKAINRGALQHFRIGKRMIRIRPETPWPPTQAPTSSTWCERDPLWPDALDLLRQVVDAHGAQEAIDRLAKRRSVRPIPVSVRQQVLARDGRTCQYCRKLIGPRTVIHLDHVVPRSKGGGNDLDNLVVACKQCNTRKGSNAGYRCPTCDHYVWYGWESHEPLGCVG